MLRRWLDVAVTRPELLAEHAAAWAQFLAAECAPAWRAHQRTALLWTLGLLCTTLGLGLAGVALMLVVLTPAGPWSAWPAPLVLWLVPGVPLALGLGCITVARRPRGQGAWLRAQRQWSADRALWLQGGPL